MQIGRRIYYDKTTGNVIVDTGERSGAVMETTREQDFEAYNALAERVPETVGYIELEYGQYAQDFAESNGYRVNPETGKLKFAYPDPSDPEPEEPVFQEPLSNQIQSLETENADLWYQVMLNESRDTQQDNDIAELFYEVMMEVPESGRSINLGEEDQEVL